MMVGIIFKNKDKIRDSISAFNNGEDTKQKFTLLEEKLNKN